MENTNDSDIVHMSRALRLAGRYQGRTSPNPTVGAVVVANGQVVGEGAHLGPGQQHAEVVALAQAGERARGATVYVTLEPCCHWGRTPPCTEALIAAGVGRVVAAMEDPNPLVASKGFRRLTEAGIPVSVGVMETEAKRLNEGFIKHIVTGLPFVTAKWAMTLDGRLATGTGDSKWITSEAARGHARELRARHGAVMVGVGTVLADDPRLTAPEEWGHPMVRIILDTNLRTPPFARLFAESTDSVIVLCGEGAPVHSEKALQAVGASIVRLAGPGPRDMHSVLRQLGGMGINSVWAEGGTMVLGSLFDHGCVDRTVAYIAPRILVDSTGLGPVSGSSKALMRDALDLRETETTVIGTDLFLTGLVVKGDSGACSRV